MDKFIQIDKQFMVIDRKMVPFEIRKAHLPNTPINPVACLFNNERDFLFRYAIYFPSYSYLPLYRKYFNEIDINDLFERCTPDDEWMADFMNEYPHMINFDSVFERYVCNRLEWLKKVIIKSCHSPVPEYIYELVDESVDNIYILCSELTSKRPDIFDWRRITAISHQSTFWRSILLKNMDRVVPSEITICNNMEPFIMKYKYKININSDNWDDLEFYTDQFDDHAPNWILQLFLERINSLNDDTWKSLHEYSWSGPLFRERPDKFDIKLVEKKVNRILRDSYAFLTHPLLKNVMFSYDYKAIRDRNSEINNSIIAWFYSPEKIHKWISQGNDIEDYEI